MPQQLTALGTVKTVNDLHARLIDKADEVESYAEKIGETLDAARKALPHGEWMGFADTHYTFGYRQAMRYVNYFEAKRDGKFDTRVKFESLRAAVKALEPPKEEKTPKTSSSDKGKPSGVLPSSEGPPDSDGSAASGPAADFESDPFEPDEPAPEGQCPNCAGSKWNQHDDGEWTCAKCVHPYGEPAGDVDDDRVTTQRAKTVKTVEALMRAFDDLHLIRPKREHPDAIQRCKVLLDIARAWK